MDLDEKTSPLTANPHQPVSDAESGLAENAELESSRGDLVLFFGILSLFLCGPLGIVAWLMAHSDLKKIREGRMSRAKVGVLKAGRVLGIIGTVLFITLLVSGVYVIYRGIPFSQMGFKGVREFGRPVPLSPHQIVFAGEWIGEKGTIIRIRPDGSADFKSRHTTVTGGRISLDETSLSIGLMGVFSKTWRIDSPPHMEDGVWTMRLNGEVFRRRAGGMVVRVQRPGPCPPVPLRSLLAQQLPEVVAENRA